jgi:hypothetical protein
VDLAARARPRTRALQPGLCRDGSPCAADWPGSGEGHGAHMRRSVAVARRAMVTSWYDEPAEPLGRGNSLAWRLAVAMGTRATWLIIDDDESRASVLLF